MCSRYPLCHCFRQLWTSESSLLFCNSSGMLVRVQGGCQRLLSPQRVIPANPSSSKLRMGTPKVCCRVFTTCRSSSLRLHSLCFPPVTTLGAELMSRSYGAAAIAPPMHEVFGVPDMTAPFGGSGVSAFVEWNYTFVVEVPFGDIPASGDTDTHECVRKVRAEPIPPPTSLRAWF